ncbi:MAG: hypothetical protein AAFU53_12465, partial [Cyanobacteria bacterium J06632_3]
MKTSLLQTIKDASNSSLGANIVKVFQRQTSRRWLPLCVAAFTLGTVPFISPEAKAEGPCTYQCDSNQIRFMPGQPLTIEFVNKTNGLINLERVLDIDMHWLRPQSDFAIETLVGADDDMSLVFWNEQNDAVNAVLHRPDAETLQIEFLPSGAESDRAVHVANDGRVLV